MTTSSFNDNSQEEEVVTRVRRMHLAFNKFLSQLPHDMPLSVTYVLLCVRLVTIAMLAAIVIVTPLVIVIKWLQLSSFTLATAHASRAFVGLVGTCGHNDHAFVGASGTSVGDVRVAASVVLTLLQSLSLTRLSLPMGAIGRLCLRLKSVIDHMTVVDNLSHVSLKFIASRVFQFEMTAHKPMIPTCPIGSRMPFACWIVSHCHTLTS
jgi:hypothetical protein